jgi:hypothetical protein
MQLYALWQELNLRLCASGEALRRTELHRPVVVLKPKVRVYIQHTG